MARILLDDKEIALLQEIKSQSFGGDDGCTVNVDNHPELFSLLTIQLVEGHYTEHTPLIGIFNITEVGRRYFEQDGYFEYGKIVEEK